MSSSVCLLQHASVLDNQFNVPFLHQRNRNRTDQDKNCGYVCTKPPHFVSVRTVRLSACSMRAFIHHVEIHLSSLSFAMNSCFCMEYSAGYQYHSHAKRANATIPPEDSPNRYYILRTRREKKTKTLAKKTPSASDPALSLEKCYTLRSEYFDAKGQNMKTNKKRTKINTHTHTHTNTKSIDSQLFSSGLSNETTRCSSQEMQQRALSNSKRNAKGTIPAKHRGPRDKSKRNAMKYVSRVIKDSVAHP